MAYSYSWVYKEHPRKQHILNFVTTSTFCTNKQKYTITSTILLLSTLVTLHLLPVFDKDLSGKLFGLGQNFLGKNRIKATND